MQMVVAPGALLGQATVRAGGAFLGFMMPRDGYGYGTMRIAERLRPMGFDVLDMQTADGDFGMEGDRYWDLSGPTVALCTPSWLPAIDAPRLISYTMFEATRLPVGWADTINRRAQACLVPCEWNAQVFRESGVRVPITVVKWGIEPKDYYPLARPELGSRPYTFLWSGTPDKRKGWDLAYRCFWRAFGANPDVKLILHFRHVPPGVKGSDDPNVEIVEGLFDRPLLRALLAYADCYLFPSRGEGWGSPPREAAATGLPVITTDWGGLHEEIEQWALPLRVKGMSKAEYGYEEWGDIGEWAEPDPDHLIELMRWCYEHQDQADVAGARAAAWLLGNATWDRTAAGVAAALGMPV